MSGAFQIHPKAPAGALPRPANDRYAEVVVGGIKTACVSRQQLTDLMVEDCLAARTNNSAPKLVFASNGHAIAMVATDTAFRKNFEAADIVHADGQPVVMGAKLMTRTPIPERTATTDFIHDAAKACVAQGLSIFLLGATEEVNARCAEILGAQYPGLKIAGRRNGYFKRDEETAICAQINASGADVVFVGLSVPFEYEFCVRNKSLLHAGWLVTCGGCYNFVTGDYKRAPGWMQKHSLEWLYRLAREPKRLFWRYAVTNPMAAFLIFTESRSINAGGVVPVAATQTEEATVGFGTRVA
ncbi:MAG TPA: WecB/TagA/CpsF family glycosyltransferase [Rhizomicrobium sp.]|jgi:exopolysaccharide biosynthesis WecB/TagA/CpsF family protein|nr:WecB/TagA/CpsF family glycosyltransferase [Rhizomicrobium sp.]